MAKMNRFSRWMVNRRTEGRARRALARLGTNNPVTPGLKVLELGCGGGGLLALLHERYAPTQLVGTDYDDDQVAAAAAFLRGRWGQLPGSVTLRSADALALPFPDGGFDVVFAMMMLHHVETHPTEYVQRPRALKETRRVLRPSGALVYSEIFRRAEIRGTLVELGFTPAFLRSSWRSDLAVFRAPP